MRKLVIIAAMVAGSLTTAALAQEGTVNGAAGGAVTGAIVGGPAGAAVGGVAGAILGTAIDPPPDRVVTYVEQQPLPEDPVVVEQEITVGKPLPKRVEVRRIPEYPKYGYAVVNHQRVIVDPSTNTVIQVIR
jgi:hypothetical protein